MNENTINDPNIFKQIRCGVCKKRVSTQLCDFVTGYDRPIFFSSSKQFMEQNLHSTCDMPLCEECAIKHNTIYDFCPHHAGLIEKGESIDRTSRNCFLS